MTVNRLRGRLDPSDVLQETYIEAARRYGELKQQPGMTPCVWLRFLAVQQLLIAHHRHLGAKVRDAGREVAMEASPDVSRDALAALLLDSGTSPSVAAARHLGGLLAVDNKVVTHRPPFTSPSPAPTPDSASTARLPLVVGAVIRARSPTRPGANCNTHSTHRYNSQYPPPSWSPPVSLPESLDVLAVAPHPDDLEIICGGTLAKLVKQGYRVGMLDITTGEPTPRGSLATRVKEAEAARKILGVPLRINLALPNRELFDTAANRAALATEFRRHRPKVVIGVFGRTPAASPDHYQAQLLIEAARFWSQLTKWDERFAGIPPYRVPHLVYAPFPFDAEQRQFHSTFVVDITDTFATKVEAIAAYESQFDLARFEKVKHWIGAQNAVQGSRCGFAYGELFALPTPVGTQDLMPIATGAQGTAAPVQLPGQGHLPMG